MSDRLKHTGSIHQSNGHDTARVVNGEGPGGSEVKDAYMGNQAAMWIHKEKAESTVGATTLRLGGEGGTEERDAEALNGIQYRYLANLNTLTLKAVHLPVGPRWKVTRIHWQHILHHGGAYRMELR